MGAVSPLSGMRTASPYFVKALGNAVHKAFSVDTPPNMHGNKAIAAGVIA